MIIYITFHFFLKHQSENASTAILKASIFVHVSMHIHKNQASYKMYKLRKQCAKWDLHLQELTASRSHRRLLTHPMLADMPTVNRMFTTRGIEAKAERLQTTISSFYPHLAADEIYCTSNCKHSTVGMWFACHLLGNHRLSAGTFECGMSGCHATSLVAFYRHNSAHRCS